MKTGLKAVETPKDSDEQLMLAYQAGDASAFDRLYARHKTAVYRFFLRQPLVSAIAEELCHDTWLRVINHRQTYAVTASFKTYLFTIARNIAIDHSNKKSTQSEVYDASLDDAYIDDNTVSQQGLQQALKQAIAALPFEQREAFLLKQEGGFSIEDIASITQQNKEKVKSSWRYALQKLRRGLSHYVEE